MNQHYDPTSDEGRREVLEEHRDLFAIVANSEEISPEVRRRYGEAPLAALDRLQEGDDDQ